MESSPKKKFTPKKNNPVSTNVDVEPKKITVNKCLRGGGITLCKKAVKANYGSSKKLSDEDAERLGLGSFKRMSKDVLKTIVGDNKGKKFAKNVRMPPPKDNKKKK